MYFWLKEIAGEPEGLVMEVVNILPEHPILAILEMECAHTIVPVLLDPVIHFLVLETVALMDRALVI